LQYPADVKNLDADHTAQSPASSVPWVIALCAEWCGQCRGYRDVFQKVAKAHPAARFFWIDIEDEDDLAGELDIETFPTVMVASNASPLFFGPLTSQAGVLHRLLQGVLGSANAPTIANEAGTQELLRGLTSDPGRLATFEVGRDS
jgi:thioredoxin 1